MSRPIPKGLRIHLNQNATTMAWLVRIERKDGVVMGFTSHDLDISYDGVNYKASSALMPSTIETSSALASDNLNLSGAISHDDITEEDLRAGLYDSAFVQIFKCNWKDINQGVILIRKALIGDIQASDGQFNVELKGIAEILQKEIGRTYVAECQLELGDRQCKVDIESFAVNKAVTVSGNYKFRVSDLPESVGYYNYGKVRFLDGNNIGLEMEIKSDASVSGEREIELFLPMEKSIDVGDNIRFYPGCDKTIGTCKNKFSNFLNYFGFPDIPGNDMLTRYPDAKS